MQKKVSSTISRRAIIAGIILLISLTTACGSSPSTSNPTSPGSPTGAATSTTPQTPTPTPTQAIDRHGLPNNVPLPNNVMFNSKGGSVFFSDGPVHLSNFSAGCFSLPTNNTWIWTTASPNTPAMVQQFYQSSLSPGQGWASTHLGSACQGDNRC